MITGVHDAISDEVCMGSPVIIIIYKKVNKQVHTEVFSHQIRFMEIPQGLKSLIVVKTCNVSFVQYYTLFCVLGQYKAFQKLYI